MPNRTICSVLDEMRKCGETRNYSYLSSLIEEVQTLVNRMEAALWDQKDFDYKKEEYHKLKKKVKEMKKEKVSYTQEQVDILQESLRSIASLDNDGFLETSYLLHKAPRDLAETIVTDTQIARDGLEEFEVSCEG